MYKGLIKNVFFSFLFLFFVLHGFNNISLAEQALIKEKTILIGILPERNIFKQLEIFEPLAKYLSKKSGINIHVKLLSCRQDFVDNFISGHFDGAFLGSFAYAYADSRINIELLAMPEGLDGSKTDHGYIFVRKDSGIKSVNDMKGKIFVFVEKVDTAGYIFPIDYLKEMGVKDYKRYFKEFYFGGTHEKAVYDVLNKKADIGAAKHTIYESLIQDNERIKNELYILKASSKFPGNVFAVRKDLDDKIKEQLKVALLLMHMDEEGREVLNRFGAKRFIEAKDEDYKLIYEFAKKASINR
jgi:phosphonate transport system substrate-binding protein